MKAPVEAQRKLPLLQSLDQKMAGTKHELKTLPAAARVAEINQELERARVQRATSQSAKKDLVRALEQSEQEVFQVQNRSKAQRQRLDSGTLSPKEMEKVQAELSQLALRQGDLEDAALDAMDSVERASEKLRELDQLMADLETELAEMQKLADSESANLGQELLELSQQREQLVAEIPDDLLAEYQAIRRSTGGLAVVEVHGIRPEGMDLEFSVAEISRLETADPDEVIISEDHEVILVRM